MSILLGCPLWGDEWIDRFLAYCLPSILEPENLEALSRGSRIVIYTNSAGARRLSGHGPILELREMPLDRDRWQTLMAVQANLLREAARDGLGLAALQPDIVFPQGYFARLDKLGQVHEAILGLGIWANSETVLTELDGIRVNSEISLHPRDLGELGWRHLHPMWKRYLMNGVDIDNAMPTSHLLGWLGKDHVRIHCSHVNPLWLSPRLCGLAKPTNTLDAIVPELLAGSSAYIAQPEDGLVPLEFAEPNNKPQHVKPSHFGDCAKAFWFNTPCIQLFQQPMRVPIHPHPEGMTDSEIDLRFSRVLGRLEGWWLAYVEAKQQMEIK